MLVPRNNRGIVQEIQDTATLLGKKGLLLGALNHSSEMDVVGFFEFLARNIGKLCLGDQRLSFGADQFLLQLDDLGASRFLILEFLDFIGDLDLPLAGLAGSLSPIRTFAL